MRAFRINTVGPKKNTNDNRVIVNMIFICESFFIPESNPSETLTSPIKVITVIIIILLKIIIIHMSYQKWQ